MICTHTVCENPSSGPAYEVSVQCGPLRQAWGEGLFPSCHLVVGFLFFL